MNTEQNICHKICNHLTRLAIYLKNNPLNIAYGFGLLGLLLLFFRIF